MFSLELLGSPPHLTPSPARLREIATRVDELVPIDQYGIVQLAFISDEEMRILNHTYRQRDTTTDVLSFHYFEDPLPPDTTEVFGEVVFSLTRIHDQALEHGHSEMRELEILIIHSLLHLIGYDHETDEDYQEMWKYEEVLRGMI